MTGLLSQMGRLEQLRQLQSDPRSSLLSLRLLCWTISQMMMLQLEDCASFSFQMPLLGPYMFG